MDEELFDDTEELHPVEEMQLNFLNLKLEKEEGLFLEDVEIFKNPKIIQQQMLEQRQDAVLRDFLIQKDFWQSAIESTREKITHLGIWEDLDTPSATPHCVGVIDSPDTKSSR